MPPVSKSSVSSPNFLPAPELVLLLQVRLTEAKRLRTAEIARGADGYTVDAEISSIEQQLRSLQAIVNPYYARLIGIMDRRILHLLAPANRWTTYSADEPMRKAYLTGFGAEPDKKRLPLP